VFLDLAGRTARWRSFDGAGEVSLGALGSAAAQ
jgi:hypothetical protein